MDNFMQTFIIVVLAAALGFTVYLLFIKKQKPGTPSGNGTSTGSAAPSDPAQDEDYTLFYNNESEGATYGDIALMVKIRNINSNKYTDSIIYYDNNLQSNLVSIGRSSSNNYYLNSRYIDKEESFYLRKKGTEFQLRGNKNSRNGISYSHYGDRVAGKITFTDHIQFYIGPVEFILYVPGCYPSANSHVRSVEQIFGDDDDIKDDKTVVHI